MKFGMINFIFLIFIVLRAYSQYVVKKIMIVKNNGSYVLSSAIGHSKINIPVRLSGGEDWVLAKDCVVCEKGSKNKEDCNQKCSKNHDEGIKCSKSVCKVLQQRQNERKGFIQESSRVSLSIVESISQQKMKIQVSLIQKARQKQETVGLVNLLNKKNIFNGQLMLIKDHSKDITIYYYENSDTNQEKPPQIIPDQTLFIKKQGLLLKVSIEANYNQGNREIEQTQLDNNQQQSNQVTQKIFNTFGVNKIGFVEAENDELSNLLIELKDFNIKLSLQTDKILLPVKTYNKFTSHILSKYFSIGDKQSPCSFHDGQLACPEKQFFPIQNLDGVLITLEFGSKKLDFPIKALMTTCKENSCSFLIGIHHEKKQIVLGDFILNIFSILFNVNSGVVTFYRLDNQWGKIYKSEQSYDLRSVNFIWMLVLLIFKSIFWILKIIGLIAMVVLILNLLYHWKEVLGWFKQIFQGIKNTDLKKKFEQQNFKDLGNKFNKMSIRIKDRLKEKIKKQSNRFKKLSPSSQSQFAMNDQIIKIASVQDLSDPESDIQAEQVAVGTSNLEKKRQIQELLERGKRDLEEKMASRGQIPTLLANQGKKFTENRFWVDQKYNSISKKNQQKNIEQNGKIQVIHQIQPRLQQALQQKLEQEEFYEFENDQFTDF